MAGRASIRPCLPLAVVAALGAGASGADASAAERQIAVLQALDKVVARISRLEAPLDRPIRFGTLEITVRVCHEALPEEPPENVAFIEIDEIHDGRPARRLYTGWMFASSPGLAAFEHPVYDIWVLNCVDVTPAAGGPASEKPAG